MKFYRQFQHLLIYLKRDCGTNSAYQSGIIFANAAQKTEIHEVLTLFSMKLPFENEYFIIFTTMHKASLEWIVTDCTEIKTEPRSVCFSTETGNQNKNVRITIYDYNITYNGTK